jgi:small redox-active disulfide protein 2
MKITILGTGCSTCKALMATVQQAVSELGIKADVVKEEDIMKIMEYNIMQLPALVIDGRVVAKGKMSLKEVKDLLNKFN